MIEGAVRAVGLDEAGLIAFCTGLPCDGFIELPDVEVGVDLFFVNMLTCFQELLGVVGFALNENLKVQMASC